MRSVKLPGKGRIMANFARIAVRSPQPFDIVGDNFSLCGLGRANEGVLGKAVLKDKNGVVLAQVAPMFVPGSGFLFTLFDFPVPVGTSATTEGTLTVEADNPSGLPQNDFRDGNLWPRLFTANRDIISDPNLIRVGQVLRVPFAGP